MRLPAGAIKDSKTRCALAVLTGSRTMDSVAERVGIVKSVAFGHLCDLRAIGFVDWQEGKHGTLHPTADFVVVKR